MSLYSAAQMGQQLASQRPGGVATGHVPQQPNSGLGPNRYVPPTFNWGRGGLDGRQPQYNQMDWNQMQAYYMPQHQNSPFTGGYMGQLQQMLGMFGNQYGGPNRQPTMPQFSSYNPGFGGPTSFYDQSLQDWGRSAMDMQRNMGQGPQGRGEYQMYGGGMGGGGGLPPGYSYDAPGDRSYTREMPTNGGRWAYGPNGERIEVGGRQGPGADYFRNLFEGGGGGMGGGGGLPPGYFDGPGSIYDNMSPEGRAYMEDMATWSQDRINREAADTVYIGFGGGGMQNPEGYSDRWSLAPSEMRGGNGGFMETIGGGGMYGREYDRRAAYEHARQQPDFDWENYGESMDGPRRPYGGNGGGFGGRGGYPTMPQFNPYMLARNNMRGMDFNQMFDPRYAMLFGMGGLGAMTPNGPQQPSGLKPGQLGGGG